MLVGALLLAAAPGVAAKLDGEVSVSALDAETRCGIGRGRNCDIKLAIKRGLFETGLRPLFPAGLACRDIDEQWAISYTHKRRREAYHGGIDMPAPSGTPIIAAAAGTVVGKYRGQNSYRGIETVLRHSPQESGFPFWIYTQYTHFSEMPKQELGQRVAQGEILGPTGNTGRGRRANVQSRRRRPAIHFAVFYSPSDKYVAFATKIIPLEGRWMDPNALFRKALPLDSHTMKGLPAGQKKVPISVMLEDGEVIPAGSKIVWPYLCSRS
ncbi:MAG: M23 family metallopeptidase [Alphaproteobacteria bacterium]|jgi:murein DD-endopeptidase MepM/ murein hydrolase activator NlpD|nr:M23 family metallopeptidase [Alphaproteobacteria bacterium]